MNNLHDLYVDLYAMIAQVDNLDKLGLSAGATLLRAIEQVEKEIEELKERMEANDI